MKRLILCCDGTWNHAANQYVSNIEKIARVLRRGAVDDGVVQVVEYVGGVGSQGYLFDKVLGGAFGSGLTHNVVDGYRFLAMNYDPGDEIVVLGYSRGAYTARSVVGMVGAVGLLTREALVAGRLHDAADLYREPADDDAERAARQERRDRFRAENSHPRDPRGPVRFLGVFDTVGTLGVPGLTRRRYRFHDVKLGDGVQVARQALSVDERRLSYSPCLWTVPGDSPEGRVRQVWFPGGHGDVGGGGPRSGLSDVALEWMVGELREVGVAIDEDLWKQQVAHQEELVVDVRPRVLFRLINRVKRLRPGSGVVDGREVFRHGLRVLARRDGEVWGDGVCVAEPLVRYVARDRYAEHAPNLQQWIDDCGGVDKLPVVPLAALHEDERHLTVR
ncbi:DUF2235 domain-containing protein [Isoptericola sediminis]|uniref:DUF2235 domain-containing protein n=1 Tax=Isoptericola sediminis TaxID=2733572 RepID=A0A849K3D5_9MICO|nr:DUF2235 domain-containing protein [Isoptericola sediminis]NNU27798.1 DUF2235 domain-containing protein [Isoptericola sediminis]